MVKREEIDYICADCGYVKSGPHAGEKTDLKTGFVQHDDYQEYKGAPVSHAGSLDCPSCGGRHWREQTEARRRKLQVAPLSAERMPGATPLQQRRRRAAAWAEVMRDMRKESES